MRAVTAIAVVGVGVGLLAALAGQPAEAHHAFAAEFDAAAPIELRGTVVRMEWVNPHTWIHIDVEEEDGTEARWMIEGGAAERAPAARVHEARPAGRHGSVRRGLPLQGRHQQGERPGRDVHRRQQAVPRLVGDRRAARRPRSDGAAEVAS